MTQVGIILLAAGLCSAVSQALGGADELASELTATPDRGRLAHEVGDLLFAVVNLAPKAGVDPRAALEGTNRRFGRRFRAVEHLARERGVDVHRSGVGGAGSALG